MSLIKRVAEKNSGYICEYRYIIVQHLMSDTYGFLSSLLENGAEVCRLFVKEYSYDSSILDKLRGVIPFDIIKEGMTTAYAAALDEAAARSREDGKRIGVLDLGGEFASVLRDYDPCGVKITVVEDTAFGHRKYERAGISHPDIAVYSVARSNYKEIEAKFVGASVVDSAERVFRLYGNTLFGKNVLVVGYGMIGKNAADFLRKKGCKVSVFDKAEYKMCRAYYEGYRVGTLAELLADNSIIFGITGETSLTAKELEYFCERVVLISGSSKQVEFDGVFTAEAEEFGEYVGLYKGGGKEVYILNKGYPINFISGSVPDSIIEFMFAEMVMCLKEDCIGETEKTGGGILCAGEESLNEIARLFLKM